MTSIVDSRRPGRRLPPTNRFADSSDDEDEEERRLVEEEEEQERILSEQHGEAEESTATRSKRQSETDDIEAEYGTTRKKLKRPTLTPAALLGPKGLIRIRSEFPRQVRWPSTTKRKEDAAAAYSRSLIQKYKSFCYDLFPGSAFEDMLTRIESFGSKKEVKTYLQSMREEIRNNHLENVYGKEKANRMIQELEHGLKQQHEMDYEEFAMNDGVNADENQGRRGPVTLATSDPEEADQPSGTNASANTEEATESQTDKRSDEPAGEKEFTFGDDQHDTDDELEIVAPRKASNTQGPLQKTAPTNPFESDEEEEHEESKSASGQNKVEQENMSIDKLTDDKNASVASPADKKNGTNEPDSDGSSDPVDEDPASPISSDETATIVATMETQLESPEQEEEGSSVFVQENPSTPSGALSSDETATTIAPVDLQFFYSPEQEVEKDEPFAREDPLTPTRKQELPSTFDETATIVATLNTQLDSPEQEEKKDEPFAQEYPLIPTREQEPTLTFDETATIVATLNTQLESPEQEEKKDEPFAQEYPLTPTREQEPTLTFDETATIVATMSTMGTQLHSPEQEDTLEPDIGSSSTHEEDERQSKEFETQADA